MTEKKTNRNNKNKSRAKLLFGNVLVLDEKYNTTDKHDCGNETQDYQDKHDCGNETQDCQINACKSFEQSSLENQKIESIKELNKVNKLEDLTSRIKSCRNCNLCTTRTNVVVSRGNYESKWMFIGEAPGEQEDLQGQPFVGMAGKLMDKMIEAMGLNRDKDVYICNVLKCRPPSNRNPSDEEIEKCKPYLFEQIDLISPKIILCFGRFAAQTILSTTTAIGKLRKIEHKFSTPNKHNHKITTVVSYHPAYLLRNPSAKKDAWEDLQLAMKLFSNIK